jgi:hypothetical protein
LRTSRFSFGPFAVPDIIIEQVIKLSYQIKMQQINKEMNAMGT